MSKDECRNDCTLPLRFPRRPGTGPATAHSESCSCGCQTGPGISADNRPALSHFNYRIGTYDSILEFLFHGLNNAPELKNWTHRKPDDPAVALMEGAAILGDILTFYQETYANEAYLRTAQWRESIADLVRLLGYRLSPPVGGKATFAFEFTKDEPVTIPAGFPLKATLEELPKPADFETIEEVAAYPWLNSFNLFRPLENSDIQPTTTEFYISSPEQLLHPVEIVAGDKLMIGESNRNGLNQPSRLENAEIVIVDSVRELHGTKIFKIKGKMKRTDSAESLVAYKIGRTFHHFGYNSPPSIVDESKNVTSTSTVSGSTTTSSTTIPKLAVPRYRPIDETLKSAALDTRFGPKEFPLDSDAGPMSNNVPVIIQAGFVRQEWDPMYYRPPHETFIATIKSHKTITAKWGAISGTVTQLNIESILDLDGDADSAKEVINGYQKAQKAVMAAETAMKIAQADYISAQKLFNSKTKESALAYDEEIGEYHTALEDLDVALESLYIRMYICDALFHEVLSPLVRIRKAQTEKLAKPFDDQKPPRPTDTALCFYGTVEEVLSLKNRRIMIVKPGFDPVVTTVNSVPAAFDAGTAKYKKLHQIRLSNTVDYRDFPNEEPFVTVYGNLVDADEGKTLPDVAIGSGDANLVFQNFKLPKTPLTYHIVTENTPSETPEIAIYVDGRKWEQVDSFFGRGKDEQIYIVREDAEGASWVQFGDGKTGARLTTGVKNVTAVYRIGDGAYGPLKEDTKVQAAAKLKNIDRVLMPSVATGGAPAEDGENARNAAPGKVQSLGRIVSLRDFESEAAAIPGVASANASWQFSDDLPVVQIVVLMEMGRAKEIGDVQKTISGYNSERGAGRDPVHAVPGARTYVTVKVDYGLKSGFRADLVEPEIRRALGVNFAKATREDDQSGLFSLRKRRFGGAEYASSIEGRVQNVDGVAWVQVTSFQEMTEPATAPGMDKFNADDPETYELPGDKLEKVIACASDKVLSLYDKHLMLTAKRADA